MLRKAVVLTALLATTVAIAACGAATPKSNDSTASNAPHRSDALKLAQCMRTHGVPQFPDLGGNARMGIQASSNGKNATISVDGHSLNVSGPAFQKAMQECSKYGPKGPPVSGAQLAKIKQGALKMAQCMRTHGVPNFPDPQVTTGPGGRGIGIRIGGAPGSGKPGFDPNSPAFQRAQKACGGLLGGPKAIGAR